MILGYKIRAGQTTTIQNLFKHKNVRGRLVRSFMILQSYEVTFECIPGKKNTAGDALSRNINSKINTEKCLSLQEQVALDET